jgi:hypothetical protein
MINGLIAAIIISYLVFAYIIWFKITPQINDLKTRIEQLETTIISNFTTFDKK